MPSLVKSLHALRTAFRNTNCHHCPRSSYSLVRDSKNSRKCTLWQLQFDLTILKYNALRAMCRAELSPLPTIFLINNTSSHIVRHFQNLLHSLVSTSAPNHGEPCSPQSRELHHAARVPRPTHSPNSTKNIRTAARTFQRLQRHIIFSPHLILHPETTKQTSSSTPKFLITGDANRSCRYEKPFPRALLLTLIQRNLRQDPQIKKQSLNNDNHNVIRLNTCLFLRNAAEEITPINNSELFLRWSALASKACVFPQRHAFLMSFLTPPESIRNLSKRHGMRFLPKTNCHHRFRSPYSQFLPCRLQRGHIIFAPHRQNNTTCSQYFPWMTIFPRQHSPRLSSKNHPSLVSRILPISQRIFVVDPRSSIYFVHHSSLVSLLPCNENTINFPPLPPRCSFFT